MLWLLLLAVLVLFLMSHRQSGLFESFQPRNDQEPKALNVLNERYARGEISTVEYNAMKKTLRLNE